MAAKGEMLYEGKAKKMYAVQGQPNQIWVEYKDSLTAFNAQKKGSFAGKGAINCQITSLIYKYLAKNGVKTHLIKNLNENEILCEKLTIVPLEVVTRNVLAGSTAKKLGIEEGTPMAEPLVEFYYKDDALADPFISDDQALFLKTVKNRGELDELKVKALQVNKYLKAFFEQIGLKLIDFKLEFGRLPSGEIVLGDEISPDTCRLWDLKTGEKMDKDRFRRDLGKVEETYAEVLTRMQNTFGEFK
jgi:phosphoribosylaminoimidazole-succinocarboxamide synthase